MSTTLLTSIPTGVTLRDRPNPTELRRAIKNPVEQTNLRQAHLADGIAPDPVHVLGENPGRRPPASPNCPQRISWRPSSRADPHYRQPSFDPILAAGDHSAVIHYSPTPGQ